MELFSTALIGIKVVEKSFDFIKKSINTVQDISELGGQIESFLDSHDTLQKQRFKKQSDPFSIKNIAQEIIDAKLAVEKMQEMSTMIDMRFGHGTGSKIVSTRRQRIKEERERIKKERILKIKRRNELIKEFQRVSIVAICMIIFITLLFIGLANE